MNQPPQQQPSQQQSSAVHKVIVELRREMPLVPYDWDASKYLCERDALDAALAEVDARLASLCDEYALLYGRKLWLDSLTDFPADYRVTIVTP